MGEVIRTEEEYSNKHSQNAKDKGEEMKLEALPQPGKQSTLTFIATMEDTFSNYSTITQSYGETLAQDGENIKSINSNFNELDDMLAIEY